MLVAEAHEKGMWYDPEQIYPLGTGPSPDYSEEGGKSIAEHAARGSACTRSSSSSTA